MTVVSCFLKLWGRISTTRSTPSTTWSVASESSPAISKAAAIARPTLAVTEDFFPPAASAPSARAAAHSWEAPAISATLFSARRSAAVASTKAAAPQSVPAIPDPVGSSWISVKGVPAAVPVSQPRFRTSTRLAAAAGVSPPSCASDASSVNPQIARLDDITSARSSSPIFFRAWKAAVSSASAVAPDRAQDTSPAPPWVSAGGGGGGGGGRPPPPPPPPADTHGGAGLVSCALSGATADAELTAAFQALKKIGEEDLAEVMSSSRAIWGFTLLASEAQDGGETPAAAASLVEVLKRGWETGTAAGTPLTLIHDDPTGSGMAGTLWGAAALVDATAADLRAENSVALMAGASQLWAAARALGADAAGGKKSSVTASVGRAIAAALDIAGEDSEATDQVVLGVLRVVLMRPQSFKKQLTTVMQTVPHAPGLLVRVALDGAEVDGTNPAAVAGANALTVLDACIAAAGDGEDAWHADQSLLVHLLALAGAIAAPVRAAALRLLTNVHASDSLAGMSLQSSCLASLVRAGVSRTLEETLGPTVVTNGLYGMDVVNARLGLGAVECKGFLEAVLGSDVAKSGNIGVVVVDHCKAVKKGSSVAAFLALSNALTVSPSLLSGEAALPPALVIEGLLPLGAVVVARHTMPPTAVAGVLLEQVLAAEKEDLKGVAQSLHERVITPTLADTATATLADLPAGGLRRLQTAAEAALCVVEHLAPTEQRKSLEALRDCAVAVGSSPTLEGGGALMSAVYVRMQGVGRLPEEILGAVVNMALVDEEKKVNGSGTMAALLEAQISSFFGGESGVALFDTLCTKMQAWTEAHHAEPWLGKWLHEGTLHRVLGVLGTAAERLSVATLGKPQRKVVIASGTVVCQFLPKTLSMKTEGVTTPLAPALRLCGSLAVLWSAFKAAKKISPEAHPPLAALIEVFKVAPPRLDRFTSAALHGALPKFLGTEGEAESTAAARSLVYAVWSHANTTAKSLGIFASLAQGLGPAYVLDFLAFLVLANPALAAPKSPRPGKRRTAVDDTASDLAERVLGLFTRDEQMAALGQLAKTVAAAVWSLDQGEDAGVPALVGTWAEVSYPAMCRLEAPPAEVMRTATRCVVFIERMVVILGGLRTQMHEGEGTVAGILASLAAIDSLLAGKPSELPEVLELREAVDHVLCFFLRGAFTSAAGPVLRAVCAAVRAPGYDKLLPDDAQDTVIGHLLPPFGVAARESREAEDEEAAEAGSKRARTDGDPEVEQLMDLFVKHVCARISLQQAKPEGSRFSVTGYLFLDEFCRCQGLSYPAVFSDTLPMTLLQGLQACASKLGAGAKKKSDGSNSSSTLARLRVVAAASACVSAVTTTLGMQAVKHINEVVPALLTLVEFVQSGGIADLEGDQAARRQGAVAPLALCQAVFDVVRCLGDFLSPQMARVLSAATHPFFLQASPEVAPCGRLMGDAAGWLIRTTPVRVTLPPLKALLEERTKAALEGGRLGHEERQLAGVLDLLAKLAAVAPPPEIAGGELPDLVGETLTLPTVAVTAQGDVSDAVIAQKIWVPGGWAAIETSAVAAYRAMALRMTLDQLTPRLAKLLNWARGGDEVGTLVMGAGTGDGLSLPAARARTLLRLLGVLAGELRQLICGALLKMAAGDLVSCLKTGRDQAVAVAKQAGKAGKKRKRGAEEEAVEQRPTWWWWDMIREGLIALTAIVASADNIDSGSDTLDLLVAAVVNTLDVAGRSCPRQDPELQRELCDLVSQAVSQCCAQGGDRDRSRIMITVLGKGKSADPLVRLAAVKSARAAFELVGPAMLVSLSEVLQNLSELMEDEDADVELAVREFIRVLESQAGESLQERLR
mmetsp:Transcript_59781/g.138209  ORF Transcript_59781/g.138209 Transcript_59781/m.138209 type:complete len:1832 (+) Transcript_59781:4455-9950(+)